MAQTVGFEPTCRFTDKLISSQPRYDHFDTSAYVMNSKIISTPSQKSKGNNADSQVLSCTTSAPAPMIQWVQQKPLIAKVKVTFML